MVESYRPPPPWHIESDLAAFGSVLRQFTPAVRAKRFHGRKTWFRFTDGLMTIEIDRGSFPVMATGTWPSTVAIRCGDLYLLSRSVPKISGLVTVEYLDGKFCLSAPHFKWKCPAVEEIAPETFRSPTDSTRLWPRKGRPSAL